MSIELPPIPTQPGVESTPAEWARYLDILRLHVSRESSEAIDRQTAQMALMVEATDSGTAAITAHNAIVQQVLDQPHTAPAPSSGFSESFTLSLLRLVLDRPEAPAP